MTKFYIVRPGDLAHSRISKALEIENNATTKWNEFLDSQGLSDKRIVRSGPFITGVSFNCGDIPKGWYKAKAGIYECYRPTRKHTPDVYDLWKALPHGLGKSSLISFIVHGQEGTLYLNSHSVTELDGNYYLSIGYGNAGFVSATKDNVIEKLGELTPIKESEWLIAQGK